MSTPHTGSPDRDDKTVLGLDRLITMANQIGASSRPIPPSGARRAFATICEPIWDPRMRADLLVYIESGGDCLKPIVVEGALLLESHADSTSYYSPPQDAETRRIAGTAGLNRRCHNPA
jgi:formate dehydrogenase subunit delta